MLFVVLRVSYLYYKTGELEVSRVWDVEVGSISIFSSVLQTNIHYHFLPGCLYHTLCIFRFSLAKTPRTAHSKHLTTELPKIDQTWRTFLELVCAACLWLCVWNMWSYLRLIRSVCDCITRSGTQWSSSSQPFQKGSCSKNTNAVGYKR